MNSDLKSALDFAIGYGSVENLEKDYKFQRRIYRVITLIEQHAAKTLGECTRTAYNGVYYRVNTPTQTATINGTPE